MNSKILVAYSTLSGSTTQVAEAVGDTLRREDAEVDVRQVKVVRDLSSYQAVVLGGPMIMGWHTEAIKFLKKQRGALSRVPVAFFMTALNLTDTGQESVGGVPIYYDPRLPKEPQNPGKLSFREKYAAPSSYLRPVLKKAPQVRPVSVAFFSGKLEYTKLNIFRMLFVMLIIQAQPGDFRNWEAIREWAGSLRPAFLGA